LHQALAISGGSVEELLKNAKRANRPILLWYGCFNLLMVWIFAPMVLGSLEIINVPGTWIMPMVIGVFVWIGLMLVGSSFFFRWGSKTAEAAYLAPLGLTTTKTPGLKPDVVGLIAGGQKLILNGPAVVEGERHGRLVHIEMIDKHSLTVVEGEMPEFQVQSNDGKLAPSKNAPDEVVKAIKSLRKAKRWKGIMVNAGPEGVGIQRQSKGQNMWLYDLWLAEYLLENSRE